MNTFTYLYVVSRSKEFLSIDISPRVVTANISPVDSITITLFWGFLDRWNQGGLQSSDSFSEGTPYFSYLWLHVRCTRVQIGIACCNVPILYGSWIVYIDMDTTIIIWQQNQKTLKYIITLVTRKQRHTYTHTHAQKKRKKERNTTHTQTHTQWADRTPIAVVSLDNNTRGLGV